MNFQAKKIIRTENESIDAISKLHISQFKKFISQYWERKFDNFKRVWSQYELLLNVHQYFDLMFD